MNYKYYVNRLTFLQYIFMKFHIIWLVWKCNISFCSFHIHVIHLVIFNVRLNLSCFYFLKNRFLVLNIVQRGSWSLFHLQKYIHNILRINKEMSLLVVVNSFTLDVFLLQTFLYLGVIRLHVFIAILGVIELFLIHNYQKMRN